jgi:hypothetical protein
MRAVDVILDTLSHFVRDEESPPPGIPVRVERDFEPTLVALCERHALSSIVLESLQKLALEPEISEFSLGRLKVFSRTIRERNGSVIETVSLLADHLRIEGVPFLIADDVVSALVSYPSPVLRPIERVGILIHERDYRKVVDICSALGFRRGITDPAFRDEKEELFYRQNVCPCTLIDDMGTGLDLICRLLDLGAPEDGERAWDKARSLDRDGVVAMRVSLEDQLLRSCTQLVMSRFEKLLFAVDAGLVAAGYGDEIDWWYIQENAEKKSYYPAFYYAYERVAVAFGLPTPAGLPNPGKTRKKIFEILWRPGCLGQLPNGTTRFHRIRFYFLENSRWSERLRVFSRLLAPRPEWVSTFFGRPCKPWLRFRFVILAVTNRLGRALGKEGLRFW